MRCGSTTIGFGKVHFRSTYSEFLILVLSGNSEGKRARRWLSWCAAQSWASSSHEVWELIRFLRAHLKEESHGWLYNIDISGGSDSDFDSCDEGPCNKKRSDRSGQDRNDRDRDHEELARLLARLILSNK